MGFALAELIHLPIRPTQPSHQGELIVATIKAQESSMKAALILILVVLGSWDSCILMPGFEVDAVRRA